MPTTRIDRRHFLAAVGAGLAIPSRVSAQASSPRIDQRLAPAEQGGAVSGLHALLVSQRGKLAFEHYGRGEDESRGRPLGTVAFAPDVLHDLCSVSTRERHGARVRPLPLHSRAAGRERARGDVVLLWRRNRAARPPDRQRHRGDAARLCSQLFDPLGFGPSEWTTGRDGEPHTASGLRLRPRDMLKVGELVLAGGAWNGRQVVPADWVKRATTPAVARFPGESYGYQWYMGDFVAGQPPHPLHWVGGIGWGGQRLAVYSPLDLVVAINCGNYRLPGREQSRIARAILNEIVLPAFV
jgi:CubicO group peptidase (beta-lactamase class C family)